MRYVLSAAASLLLALVLLVVYVLVTVNYYGESCDGCEPWGLKALLWGAGLSILAAIGLLIAAFVSAIGRRSATNG